MTKHTFHKPRAPKHQAVRTALYNVAAIASIVAIFTRSDFLTVGATGVATIYHVVVLVFIDDNLI